MKKFFTLKLLLLMVLLIGGLKGWGQLFWRTDGTPGAWTANNWSNPASPTGGTTWTANTDAIFSANSTVTFASTNVANITVNNGLTVNITAAATLSTNGTVRTLNTGTGSTLTWPGQAISTASGVGVIKSGTGTWDMGTQPNVFNATNGGFTINAGTLIVGGNNNFGGAPSLLTINGGTIQSSGARAFANNIVIGGDFTFSGTGNATFSGSTNLGAATRNITNNMASGSLTYSGIISGAVGSGLTFSGSGQSILTGTNTYTGPTTINGGTLSIPTINNGGVAGNIGAATNSATNLVFGGGTLLYTGPVGTTDRNFTLTNGTTSTISNANTLTLSGAAASSTGSLIKAGTGTLVFSGSNQYTGTTTINAGILQITASERINDASALSISGGTFDLNGFNETVGSLSGSGIITSSIAGASTFIVGGDNSSTTFSGNIQNGSGTVSLTKQGTGTLTLTGTNNTYTGTTTINGGTLQLNKSGGTTIPVTNSVNVNNTGTLQISQNQTLANVTLAAGSTLTLDAGKTLTVTGTLTVNTGAIVNGAGSIAYLGGALVYNGSGSLTAGIEWPTSAVPASVTINSGATVILTSVPTNRTTTGSQINVDFGGTLDASTYSIIGNGTVNINGTLMTENPNGFVGTGASFTGGTVTILLGVNSIINYAALGDQQVQGSTAPTYVNVTFSGSGTKTLASNNVVSGKITVSGSAIFDAGNHTFGGTGTTLDMTGTSTYRTAGTTTKPDATGSYSLGPNTTIDFSNSFATEEIISSAHTYANILVSGGSVADTKDIFGPSTITIQAGGSFNVTGTFNVHSVNGFSGAANTAISNTNNPTINLQAGSTIQYNRSDGLAQLITNSVAYQNLAIAGTGNKTAPSGILTINGNFTKSGTSTFLHNNGTVLFDGGATAQNYSANAEVLFNNVTNNNPTGLSINSDMAIAGQLTLSDNSIFNLASGNVTLKSSATSTANVATIPSTASITYGTGAFTVERYMQAARAWRFLAIPAQPGETIKAAWQEGALNSASNPVPTYGTQISSDLPNPTMLGFDFASAAGGGTSVKSYDPATQKFVGIATTNALFDPSLGGYMAFIRGDRTITGFSATATQTTLRIKGALFKGDNSPATIPMNQTTPVNNPFASRIDLSKIDPLHQFTFYIWDPTLGGTTYGVGAFRTISWDGSAYTIAPSVGYTGSVGFIESGQAFFARGFSSGNLIMDESVKSAGSALVSAPVSSAQEAPQLQTNLYAIEDGNAVLKDGVVNSFDDTYDNAIDGADAVKFANFNENFSISRENKLLEIERRHTIVESDTIFLHFSGLGRQSYRFELVAVGLGNNGFTGFVEDNYLHTKTALDLTGSTLIDFNINADEASSASNRFRIVMNAAEAGPLPVTVTNVQAYVQNANIAVEWEVVNESGVQNYEIEKSVDGIHFQKAGSVSAKNLPANNYKWLDEHTVVGYNYYRIRILNVDGKINYTNIVKAFVDKLKSLISVYPNPIRDGSINLQLANQPAGEYRVRLLNKLGQSIFAKQIYHAEGSATELIKTPGNLAHGMYQLEITKPGSGVIHLHVVY